MDTTIVHCMYSFRYSIPLLDYMGLDVYSHTTYTIFAVCIVLCIGLYYPPLLGYMGLECILLILILTAAILAVCVLYSILHLDATISIIYTI